MVSEVHQQHLMFYAKFVGSPCTDPFDAAVSVLFASGLFHGFVLFPPFFLLLEKL